jgi:hypothetical protein
LPPVSAARREPSESPAARERRAGRKKVRLRTNRVPEEKLDKSEWPEQNGNNAGNALLPIKKAFFSRIRQRIFGPVYVSERRDLSAVRRAAVIR